MPVLQALIAALTFGLSAPLAKLLLASVSPLFLAGLLYAGAGLFLTAVQTFRRPHRRGRAMGPSDWWTLAAAVSAGGILAPPLLLWGLSRGSASATALLLNLEVAFTALLAGVVFGEHVGLRVAAGVTLMAAGGMAVSRPGSLDLSLPSLAVAGACALWALDNNLTRLIADIDAVVLAQVKGVTAGAVNVTLALSLAHQPPTWKAAVLSLALGALSYGSSLALFILAMRGLGAARTAAYFALAPFFGAAMSLLLLRDRVSVPFLLAAGLMGAGAWLLVRERHIHAHRHEAGVHTHRHVRDEHHSHEHEGWEGPEPHVHPHATGPHEHAHPHFPDQDHQHRHD
jgi:drug/metabolite transporter (DMT)-like permease